MICPVVTYAPTAATKPNIAAQPLKRSASGVIFFKRFVNKYNIFIYLCKDNIEKNGFPPCKLQICGNYVSIDTLLLIRFWR